MTKILIARYGGILKISFPLTTTEFASLQVIYDSKLLYVEHPLLLS